MRHVFLIILSYQLTVNDYFRNDTLFYVGFVLFGVAVTLVFIGCVVNCMWLRKAESSRHARVRRAQILADIDAAELKRKVRWLSGNGFRLITQNSFM